MEKCTAVKENVVKRIRQVSGVPPQADQVSAKNKVSGVRVYGIGRGAWGSKSKKKR
jgi:hypothetical protein